MAKTTKKEAAPKDKSAGSKKESKKKGKEPESTPQKTVQFFKDSWSEFRKIQWPTPKQATNESIVVLLTVLFIIALVKLYDYVSIYVLHFILK